MSDDKFPDKINEAETLYTQRQRDEAERTVKAAQLTEVLVLIFVIVVACGGLYLLHFR